MKSVFTIHNIEYQGKFDMAILGDVFDLPDYARNTVEFGGCINLMKGGIECCDLLSTVSPSYAQELHYGYYAHALENIIGANSDKMRGILNGIDEAAFDPRTDGALFAQYSSGDTGGKARNKSELQKLAGLAQEADTPLIAVVSRLAAHKGIDLICHSIEEILRGRVQLIVLGKGEARYEDYFLQLAKRYQGKAAALIQYNQDLARKVYAGADMLLMPSRSEPCGLAQMIASRYGTAPVVRATGGLRDSIADCSLGEGNGFVFEHYAARELLDAVRRALERYERKADWEALRRHMMNVDFSWSRSARLYAQMYRDMGRREGGPNGG